MIWPGPDSGPRIPRTVWALGMVSLLMDVSSEMVQTLLPLYLVSGLGASVLALGVIEGLAVAIATVSKFFAGALADWTGRNKPLALLGYGLGMVSRFLFPLAESVDQIVLARAVDRVGKGIRSTPRDALIAGVSPPQIRGASFGLRKSLDTVGGFLGPLIAVGLMLALGGNIPVVFWIAVVPASLAILVLLLFVSEPSVIRASTPRWPRMRDVVGLGGAFWAVITVASAVTLARFSEAFVLLKSLDAGFAPAFVPLAMVVMHAAYGLTAYPVGRSSDRIGPDGLLMCSLGFLIASHLTLAWADTVPVFGLGTVFWGLHMGFSQGLFAAMVGATAPEALKGTAFGTFNLVTGLIVLLGNVLCGWLWHSFGAVVPFVIGACLSCVAMVVLALTRRARQG